MSAYDSYGQAWAGDPQPPAKRRRASRRRGSPARRGGSRRDSYSSDDSDADGPSKPRKVMSGDPYAEPYLRRRQEERPDYRQDSRADYDRNKPVDDIYRRSYPPPEAPRPDQYDRFYGSYPPVVHGAPPQSTSSYPPPPGSYPAPSGYGSYGAYPPPHPQQAAGYPSNYEYPPPGYDRSYPPPQYPPPPHHGYPPAPSSYHYPPPPQHHHHAYPPPPGYSYPQHTGYPALPAYGDQFRGRSPRRNAGGGRGGGDGKKDGSGGGRGAGGGRGRGKRKRDKSDDVAPVASMDTPIDHAILQKLTLEEVLPRLVDAAQEQDGSRFLQMKLDEQDESVRRSIFDAAVPEVEKLAKDVFGNFVVQKLLEHGDAGQQMEVAGKLENDAVNLSCHKYACRVMQKALQVLPPVLQTKLVTELTKSVITCIENMHGNHVIQKCVEHMPADSLVWIITPVNDRVEYVCTHMYGCRIMQRLLEKCRSHHLEGVLNQLMAPATIAKLARDKHGNYVVQCILEHGAIMDKQRILDSIQQNLADYCRNKISSNVVEKCFQIATMSANAQDLHDQRRAMMEVVLAAHGGKQSLLEDIMNDKFGNYIVQSIIKYSRGLDPDHRARLQEKLEALEPQMKETTTGKHIIATMEKEFRTAP